jgi:hypothetical protein
VGTATKAKPAAKAAKLVDFRRALTAMTVSPTHRAAPSAAILNGLTIRVALS